MPFYAEGRGEISKLRGWLIRNSLGNSIGGQELCYPTAGNLCIVEGVVIPWRDGKMCGGLSVITFYRAGVMGIRWGFDWGKVGAGALILLAAGVVLYLGHDRPNPWLLVVAGGGLITMLNGLMGEEGIW